MCLCAHAPQPAVDFLQREREYGKRHELEMCGIYTDEEIDAIVEEYLAYLLLQACRCMSSSSFASATSDSAWQHMHAVQIVCTCAGRTEHTICTLFNIT